MYFYPRPPRGGRLFYVLCGASLFNISIHALREEGDQVGNHPAAKALISIHALREEGDWRSWPVCRSDSAISIHALREEGDSKNRDKISIFKQIIQHSARI